MDKNSTTTNSGLGFPAILTIVFIVLKLTNVIEWSWWWVLSPIWITAGLTIAVIAIIFIVSLIIDIYNKYNNQ